jgi:hypothetical protein
VNKIAFGCNQSQPSAKKCLVRASERWMSDQSKFFPIDIVTKPFNSTSRSYTFSLGRWIS